MTDPDDELLTELTRLDPTHHDGPPAPGSTRHHSILEHAMTTTAPVERPRRPARRTVLALGAAAAVVAAIGIAVLVEPGQDPTPASATEVLTSAATTTGDASTLRAAGTYDHGGGHVNTLTSDIDGADYTLSSTTTGPDGSSDERTVVIGDQVWEDEGPGGAFLQRTAPPEERNAPFAESSEAVVKAALAGSEVTDLGTEEVRGQETTHYRIALTPRSISALAELTPSQLARFELENPGGVDHLDVWVSDDLIRRIQVVTSSVVMGSDHQLPATATIEFFDFGADIAITPPT